MDAGGPHNSPGLSDTGNVCPQGMGPGQGAEKVQVRGVEEANGAISTATKDVVLTHRNAVGHGGLQAEGLRSVEATCQPLLNNHLPRGETNQGTGEGKAAQLLWPEPISCYVEMPLPPAAGGQRAHSHVLFGGWESRTLLRY